MCARRRHLSLELSLGIVFFTNIVLSLAALTYIVSGINTDIFTWAKDYLAALKDDDSAVNTKACTHTHRLIQLLVTSCFELCSDFARTALC